MLDILDAPAPPRARLTPDRKWLVVIERDVDEVTIAQLAEPALMLAGHRFKQYPDSRIENIGITRISIQSLDGSVRRRVVPPAGGFINEFVWVHDGSVMAYTTIDTGAMAVHTYDAASGVNRLIVTPGIRGKVAGLSFTMDGRYMSFTATTGANQALWMADMRAGSARPVEGVNINHAAGLCSWVKGQPPLICTAIVANRGAPPVADEVPKGPIVQESYGRCAAGRTFQDLLKTPQDEALFDYYLTSQIVSVAADGSVTRLGAPGVYVGIDPSPDGEYLLVQALHRPYSYQVPMSRFPKRTAVWDRSGNEIKVVLDAPLIDNMPSARDAVLPGIRSISWRSDVPATLVLVEALDNGDPDQAVPKRDRVSLLAAPFAAPPVKFLDTELRFSRVIWAFPDLAFLVEGSSRTTQIRAWVLNPAMPGAPRRLWERSREDRYTDPGRFVSVPHPTEPRSIPLRSPDGKSLYLHGEGASPEGERPFVDRLDLATLKTERLWQSTPPHYECLVEVLDPQAQRLIITRESPAQQPNYFLYDVTAKQDLRQLTELPDPAPWFAQVKGERIRYKRDDGIELSATLYLPPGYDAKRDGRLPFFFWAYPLEFLTATGASQLAGSPLQFKRPARQDYLMLLALGYGVLDSPSMPIVGNGREPNDSYVEQLVAGARAAVDTLVERGVADRHRIGIGGHSYGAFMTANLLAHSALFRAGIARSGAYNRSLTPFGFQAEPRTYWQATGVYTEMSPFTYANKISQPLLMIHGMRDSNEGTFPVQSERMYAAIKGNGGNVRYVQLPLEDHGYRARESRRHVLWEMTTWLDKYVRNAPPRSLLEKEMSIAKTVAAEVSNTLSCESPGERSLEDRASTVLSPGIYGGRYSRVANPGMPTLPKFFTRASGARIWDSEGREYIDFIGGFGTNLLGYGDERVEMSAARQRQLLGTAPVAAPVMVDLAEILVDTVTHADWALFAKNGTDAVSTALLIARALTRKRRVLVASGAYHGCASWCNLIKGGVLLADQAFRSEYIYNDIDSLEAAVADAGDDLAAIIASGFKHDSGVDLELPRQEYARRCRELCDRTGALLIIDDVRAGFRVARDCSWSVVGVEPDLSCWGKALANGYPLSAVLGSNRVRDGADRMYAHGTFWLESVPMAAALATVRIIRETDYLEHMIKLGETLRHGLSERAAMHGIEIVHSGPVQMPLLRFKDDHDLRYAMGFFEYMVGHGIHWHPLNNLFLCAAMTSADIHQTVDVADKAFAYLVQHPADLKPHPLWSRHPTMGRAGMQKIPGTS